MRQLLLPIGAVFSLCVGVFCLAALETKQLLFMVVLLVAGSLGSLYHPFWGVLLYYTFATLRPQYLWDWSLPQGVRWSLFAAGAVLLGCVLNASKLMERRRVNRVMALMLLYCVLLVFSILTAHSPSVAMGWGIEYGKIMLIGLIASVVIRHLWQIRIITAMIMVALGYIAWEINYLYLFDGRLDIFHKGYGGLDNNGAGLMLGMGIPIAYAFAVSAKARWQRAACWMIAVFMLHGVLMSYSRGAMLAVALAAMWILLNHRPRRHAVVILLVACMAVSLLAGKEIRSRFQSMTSYSQDVSAQSRLESWKAGWDIAKAYPLTGQGIRNSNIYSRNFGADYEGRTIHSQYVQIAADSGIPAMLVYVAMLGTALLYVRRSRGMCLAHIERQREDDPDADPDPLAQQFVAICLGCEASLAIFAVGGVFLSLEVFELSWLFLVLAGVTPGALALHLDELTGRDKRANEKPRRKLKRRPRPKPRLVDPAEGLLYP